MFSPFVPYNPSTDTPLAHRNLILIYCVVWLLQLGYGVYATRRWIVSRKRDR
jgi:hypothetical protein